MPENPEIEKLLAESEKRYKKIAAIHPPRTLKTNQDGTLLADPDDPSLKDWLSDNEDGLV